MAVVELSTTYVQACMLGGGERDTWKERESIKSKCLSLHQPCPVLAEQAGKHCKEQAKCLNMQALQVGESSPQGY
jgi:hypothetical protein